MINDLIFINLAFGKDRFYLLEKICKFLFILIRFRLVKFKCNILEINNIEVFRKMNYLF